MSNSLQPHGLQHARLPCPSLSSRLCSDSCPWWSPWWYLTISFSATRFFCLQSFPALESFPMSWLFASGSQNIGASASASVLPMNIQGWFPLGWIGLISLQSTISESEFCFVFFLIHQFNMVNTHTNLHYSHYTNNLEANFLAIELTVPQVIT